MSDRLCLLLTAAPRQSPLPVVLGSFLGPTATLRPLPVLMSVPTSTFTRHSQDSRDSPVGGGHQVAVVIFSYPSPPIIRESIPRQSLQSCSFNASLTNKLHHSICTSDTSKITHSEWRHMNRLKQIHITLAMEGIETNPGPNKDNMIISHVNINSITSPNRLQELNQFIVTNKIDIIALTETKLDNTINPSLYHLDDFHAPFTNHRNRHGGGTALYAHSSLPIKRRHNLELPGEEWIWAQIDLHDVSLLICCVYLPPNISAQRQADFIDRLTESMTIAQTYSPTSIIVLGDMNVGNIFLQTTSGSSGVTPFDIQLKEAMDVLDLTQLINEPTRPDRDTSNLRDLIFTSNIDIVVDSGVLSPFSRIDHFPIYAVLDMVKPAAATHHQKCIWDYDKLDSNLLTDLLLNTDWETILSKDIDEATTGFTCAILDAAKTAIPIKTVSTSKRHKPWMTTELIRNIKKRDRLFRQAKKHQRESDWQRWKVQRNYVTDLNRRNREGFIKTKVNALLQSKQSPFKYHNTLKSIIGRANNHNIPPLENTDGNIITENGHKAALLNSHFAKQSDLQVDDNHNPLDDPGQTDRESNAQTPKLETITLSPNEVLSTLNSLDPNKSCGPDELPPKLLKLVALLIHEPLTQLFNNCLHTGTYPSIWKQANVHPIYKKKGSPSDPTNYRPISLLPCLSKVFGRLVFKHIYKHLTDHQLLSPKQSGYRPGHSTQIQLLHLTQSMYSNIDNGNDFTAVYLDISKYFDRIWHNGLLLKCEYEFGISGSLLNWIRSYLKDRQQRVRVEGTFSQNVTINAGCPQGSVLGPLLALMYLNNLTTKISNEALLFADDISLYAPHNSQNILDKQHSLQNDLNSIYSYGQKWHITFNATKTIMQTFTLKRDTQQPQLTFGGVPIQQTYNHKHLGLTLSKDLRFHSHINDVILKINRAMSSLYPIAKYVPRQILAQIYTTYVQPHYDYCDVVYDKQLTLQDSQRLQTLQNRAARLITGVPFRTPTSKLLQDLGWDKLLTRRLIHRLMTYFNLKNDKRLPDYITSSLPHTRQNDTSRTLRNASALSLPPNQTTLFQRSFFPATIRDWNKLPESIRSTNRPKSFKREILKRLGAPTPPVYYSLGSKIGNTLHTNLRVDMSYLNVHLYPVQKSSTPLCNHDNLLETPIHFITNCTLYADSRSRLYDRISEIIQLDFTQLPNQTKTDILLHGTNLGTGEREGVARSFQQYLLETKRFI